MNNLALYRAKAGLNQRELGEKVGLGDASISFFEHSTLSVKNAEKIAKILNVNVIALLGADALKVLPKTEEEKQILIDIIKGL
jgi:transcriptional regulator with XRE-family HTH domain